MVFEFQFEFVFEFEFNAKMKIPFSPHKYNVKITFNYRETFPI